MLDHHHGSTVARFDFVEFRTGVVHEDEGTRLEVEVLDGVLIVLLKLLS